MKKAQKTGQASASVETQRLTWREERFVEAYCESGNATAAVKEAGFVTNSARQYGYNLLTKSYILAAVEETKNQWREQMNFTKEKGLRILIGMATASLDDFTPLFGDPANRSNYKRLGYKRMGLESAKKTVSFTEDGGERVTNEVRIISPGERRAAINDLWEKLGLDKAASGRDRLSFLERFAQLGSQLGRKDQDGESGSGKGS